MNNQTLRRLALASLAGFLRCAVAVQLLLSALDKARHEISEYVLTTNG